jgi:hypothetical protein
MKVTKETLKKIIKEEIQKMIKESDPTQWEAGRGRVASRFQEPPPPAPQDPYVREKTTVEQTISKHSGEPCDAIIQALMKAHGMDEKGAKRALDFYEQDYGRAC